MYENVELCEAEDEFATSPKIRYSFSPCGFVSCLVSRSEVPARSCAYDVRLRQRRGKLRVSRQMAIGRIRAHLENLRQRPKCPTRVATGRRGVSGHKTPTLTASTDVSPLSSSAFHKVADRVSRGNAFTHPWKTSNAMRKMRKHINVMVSRIMNTFNENLHANKPAVL